MPHDDDMDSRLTALETRFDTILPTLATKSDLAELRAEVHKMSSEVKGWFIATAIVVVVAMFTIANVMLSHVKNQAAPAASPAPIIIQVPTQVPPPQSK